MKEMTKPDFNAALGLKVWLKVEKCTKENLPRLGFNSYLLNVNEQQYICINTECRSTRADLWIHPQ
jgi:hypothetical protein